MIYTINVGMRKICGAIKNTTVKLINQIITIPQSTYIIAWCSDGRFRYINAIVDTIQPTFSFVTDKKIIYQHESISFCPVIPSFDSCSIEWSFDNGKTSNSINPNHTFTTPGIYDVTMKVTDNTGQHIVTEQKLIEVKPTPNPITLDFEADVKFGVIPLSVRFTNKSTGTILSYKWDFGDGTTSSAKDITHIFTKQSIYSIKLTVNNGIKDTSLTKYHYINADEYPSYGLTTKHLKSFEGEYNNDGKYTVTLTSVFENMIRDNEGKTFLKLVTYRRDVGGYGTFARDMCGSQTKIYMLQNNQIDKQIIETQTGNSGVVNNFCKNGSGVLGALNNNSLSYFANNYVRQYNYSLDVFTFILNSNGNSYRTIFPYYSEYYHVRALRNNIDCYSFRKDRGLSTDSSLLCFYTDTTKLIAKDNVKGYALPAIETSTGKFLSVISPLTLDTVESKKLQLRWYDEGGLFLDSMTTTRPTADFIYDIIRIPNNKYMMCGNTTLFGKDSKGNITTSQNGLILIMDENGTIEVTKLLPQWKKLKRITRMDDRTYAVTGTPVVGYPGFLAVKSDGTIAGDFRADITRGNSNAFEGYDVTACQTCVDVSFGNNINTIFFTRNNGYNAELYVSDNPYLKDINVSVEENIQPETSTTNSILLSPNPTDDITTLHYNSTMSKRITITIASVLGEVLFKQEIEVGAGKNEIPLDVRGFDSGVVFVRVTDGSSVDHGQIYVVR